MQDYEPLDISRSCNSGPEILGSGAGDMETGLRSFRGLPFMIGGLAGGIGGSSFIAPSPNGGSVFVPVGKAAKKVLFAHALLETKLAEGGKLGEPVAVYVFYLSSGRQERVNIRERFEIAASPSFPPGTPGPPYRAVTDSKATLMPRYEGEFDAAGKRQTEANHATAELCWLWSWENPEPDSSIETIEIVPAGMSFFIAAITLGHLDEHPFRERDAARRRSPCSTRPTPPSLSTWKSRWTGGTPPTSSHYPPCRPTSSSPRRIRGGRTTTSPPARPTLRYRPLRPRP